MSLSACSLVIRDPATLSIPPAADAATISRADALADLEFLIRALNRVHPDPYRFHSPEVVEASRRRVVESMPASLTRTGAVSALQRGDRHAGRCHTSMACEQLVIAQWERAAKASPPQTQPNDAPGVEPGDRLLRLNGQDADALLAAWAGPHTYSAAAEFAEAVKTYGLVTIVGKHPEGSRIRSVARCRSACRVRS